MLDVTPVMYLGTWRWFFLVLWLHPSGDLCSLSFTGRCQTWTPATEGSSGTGLCKQWGAWAAKWVSSHSKYRRKKTFFLPVKHRELFQSGKFSESFILIVPIWEKDTLRRNTSMPNHPSYARLKDYTILLTGLTVSPQNVTYHHSQKLYIIEGKIILVLIHMDMWRIWLFMEH